MQRDIRGSWGVKPGEAVGGESRGSDVTAAFARLKHGAITLRHLPEPTALEFILEKQRIL